MGHGHRAVPRDRLEETRAGQPHRRAAVPLRLTKRSSTARWTWMAHSAAAHFDTHELLAPGR